MEIADNLRRLQLRIGTSLSIVSILSVSRAGYRTIFTADGNDALALYRKHQPQLLIADLGLPGIDGRALSKAIQEEFPFAQILLTSGYKIDLDSTGKTSDGFAFLPKPFEQHRLMTTIERMISLSHNLRNDPPARPRH